MDVEAGDVFHGRMLDDEDRQLRDTADYVAEHVEHRRREQQRPRAEARFGQQTAYDVTSFRHEDTARSQKLRIGHVAIIGKPRILR